MQRAKGKTTVKTKAGKVIYLSSWSCRTCRHTAKRGEMEPCCDCRMDKDFRWSKWEAAP